ncbi:14503_t:CDS:2, partial [Rhizophagus irregularis]
MVKSINNKQQIIQQLKLNHGLLLGEYSIQPSRQAVFMEDGELNISLCNRQPIVYDLSIDKDNSNNMLQPSDMCINFPIAEITYKGDVSKSFSSSRSYFQAATKESTHSHLKTTTK